MSICFIILAAGQSKRLNSNIPKPYIDYKGKPIVQHSIDKAKKCKKISKIILIINKKHRKLRSSLLRSRTKGSNSFFIKQITPPEQRPFFKNLTAGLTNTS